MNTSTSATPTTTNNRSVSPQQNANSIANAMATADYYEQQFKMQQQKSFDIEQQFRRAIEQNNEFKVKKIEFNKISIFETFFIFLKKETLNNLNDINRKLYEENGQYKERNLEQRKQIEHMHMLLIETKQSNDLNQNLIQKKADECIKDLQKEIDVKKRQLQDTEQKQKDLFSKLKTFSNEINELKLENKSLVDTIGNQEGQFNEDIAKLRLNFSNILQQTFDIELKKLKDNFYNEKYNLETQIELQKKQFFNEKSVFETEKYELQSNIRDLELKLEEIIKEKAQFSYRCGQVTQTNRDLSKILDQNEIKNEEKLNEVKEKLDFYVGKCNDLEKEIAECQEDHVRKADDWKKFQADLQTAVRVANDFMTGKKKKKKKFFSFF
jgi:hypothetical protein